MRHGYEFDGRAQRGRMAISKDAHFHPQPTLEIPDGCHWMAPRKIKIGAIEVEGPAWVSHSSPFALAMKLVSRQLALANAHAD